MACGDFNRIKRDVTAMKAGIIAKVDEEYGTIESFENRIPLAENEVFESLNQCVQIREDIELADGRIAQVGRAAVEEISTDEAANIEDGEIRVFEESEKNTNYTEFLSVPGSFVAASSNSGRFVFDLLSSHVGANVTPVTFNLQGYLEERESADPWKVGFKNRTGNAENGVVHGEELLRDGDLGNPLKEAKKNQIGLEYNKDGYLLKTFVVESGYVEVYQPNNFDTREFIDFVESDLLHHASLE